MTIKDFLINEGDKGGRLNLSGIAKIMYPTNKTANESLSRKLKGIRPWTSKDEMKAVHALMELHIDIEKVVNGESPSTP